MIRVTEREGRLRFKRERKEAGRLSTTPDRDHFAARASPISGRVQRSLRLRPTLSTIEVISDHGQKHEVKIVDEERVIAHLRSGDAVFRTVSIKPYPQSVLVTWEARQLNTRAPEVVAKAIQDISANWPRKTRPSRIAERIPQISTPFLLIAQRVVISETEPEIVTNWYLEEL